VLLPYPTQDDAWLEPLREIVTDPVEAADEFRNFLASIEFPAAGFYSSDSE
jgi:hypothetical protein